MVRWPCEGPGMHLLPTSSPPLPACSMLVDTRGSGARTPCSPLPLAVPTALRPPRGRAIAICPACPAPPCPVLPCCWLVWDLIYRSQLVAAVHTPIMLTHPARLHSFMCRLCLHRGWTRRPTCARRWVGVAGAKKGRWGAPRCKRWRNVYMCRFANQRTCAREPPVVWVWVQAMHSR